MLGYNIATACWMVSHPASVHYELKSVWVRLNEAFLSYLWWLSLLVQSFWLILIRIALNVSRSRWTPSPPRWAYRPGSVPKGYPSTWPNSIIMSRGTQLNLQASLFIHTCWCCVISSWSLRLNHNVWTILEYNPARMIHETNTKLCHIKLKEFTNSSDHT